MNNYDLSKRWFDFSYEHTEIIKPTHTALYFYIIDHWNRLGWKENFGLPSYMTMEALGIKSFNTFKKTFDDLVSWGFIILIQKSKNQYSTNVIAVSKNNKALDEANNKALDRALSKHASKHCRSTHQSIVTIDKPNNLITLKPKNKEISVEETEVFDIEEIPESPADIKYENLHDGSAQACLRKRYGRHSGDAAFTVLENMNGWPEYMTKRKINAFDRWIQNLHERGNSLTKFQFDQELSKFKNWSDVQAEENCGHSLPYPQIYEKSKSSKNVKEEYIHPSVKQFAEWYPDSYNADGSPKQHLVAGNNGFPPGY